MACPCLNFIERNSKGLFLSGKVKDAIFSKSAFLDKGKKYVYN